jgi:hypothetical protein
VIIYIATQEIDFVIQLKVDLQHICEKIGKPALYMSASTTHSSPSSDVISSQCQLMYTGADIYKNMEVAILSGDAKQHYGVIVASRTVKGRLVLDVQTTTWTINTLICLPKQDIKEQ